MNLDFRSEKLIQGARSFAAAHQDGHVCGQCRYAQMFAVQPRAACAAGSAANAGQVMSVTRAACRHYAERPARDTAMAQSLAHPVEAPAVQFANAA